MKKIGLISLALVLALGALGIGYAAWTDQVTIEGTIETGFVAMGVRGEAELAGDPKKAAGVAVREGTFRFEKGDESYYDSIAVDITNMFPCVTVTDTFWIGVPEGSIPLKLQIMASSIWVDPADPNLFDFLNMDWTITGTHNGGQPLGPITGEGLGFYGALQGLQLHGCDTVKLEIVKTLEQNDDAQGLSGGFAVTVSGIQWNKYTPPGDPPDDPPGECWEGETAMSDGNKYPNHAWFMYTPYGREEVTVDLLAGSELIKVGEVTFSDPVGGWVTITIDLEPDARFDPASDLKISVKGYTNEDDAKAEGSWPFCTWPFKGMIPDATMTSFSFDVPANSVSGAPYLFYALHADVERQVVCPD